MCHIALPLTCMYLNQCHLCCVIFLHNSVAVRGANCNELGVMGSKVNLTQNRNRHNPMNV